MKSNNFKKFLSLLATFAYVFIISGMQSHAALARNIFLEQTVESGSEAFFTIGNIDGHHTLCDVDATTFGRYKVQSNNADTMFVMFIKENGQLIAENTFTGSGQIDLEQRKYQALTLGVKNIMDKADTFSADLYGSSVNCGLVKSSAARIFAPVTAILGALLFLF